MSDISSPQDPAIEALRERERQLDADVQQHIRNAEVATACRNEVRELIALLTRKARVRKPRVVGETANGTPVPARDPLAIGGPAFVFAPPEGAA
jgi:hypothetical protein